MSGERKSKHWIIDPKINITEFNLDTLNEKNLINQLLVLKQSDISYSVIMN